MAKYKIENEKYYIRPIEESDWEQVKSLLKENKIIKKIMELEETKEAADSIIYNMYMDPDICHCILSKESDTFCGYIIINPETDSDEEGEMSIRLQNSNNINDMMVVIGDVLKEMGHGTKKGISIQYSFD